MSLWTVWQMNNAIDFLQVSDLPAFSDVVSQVVVLNSKYEGPPSRQVTFMTKEGGMLYLSIIELIFNRMWPLRIKSVISIFVVVVIIRLYPTLVKFHIWTTTINIHYISVPGPVRSLEVSLYGPQWLEIQWSPPVESNGILRGYRIAVSSGKYFTSHWNIIFEMYHITDD